MTTDETLQLFRTTSLSRLRLNIEDAATNNQLFYEQLITLLQRSQRVDCHHRWEIVGGNQRCLDCGKTLLIPQDTPLA